MLKIHACLILLAAGTALGQSRDEWRAVYHAGKHIGYERTKYDRDRGRFVATRESRYRARGLQVESYERTEADVETATLKRHEFRSGREDRVTSIGKPSGGFAQAETVQSDRSRWNRVPADLRSSMWFTRQLLQNPMPPQSRLRFSIWRNREAMDVTIVSRTYTRVAMPDGTRQQLLPLVMQIANDPDATQTMFMNELGQVVLTEFKRDGLTFTKRLVPPAAARTKNDSKLFDLVLAQFVPADRTLQGGRDTETAEYAVSGPESLLRGLHHEPRQLSKAATDGAIELTVRSTKPRSLAPTRRVHSDYLRSTKLLDHRDTNVSTFAREAAAGEFNAAAIAHKLQRAVGARIRNRSFSAETLPASQILQLREGDCTEHAVLLAAVLRARRIPSRVVAGLVYLDGKKGFSGHMWTEAMINGQWTALDATFARKRRSKEPTRIPGAGYLTVAHSSLQDEESVLDVFMPVADLMKEVSIKVIR